MPALRTTKSTSNSAFNNTTNPALPPMPVRRSSRSSTITKANHQQPSPPHSLLDEEDGSHEDEEEEYDDSGDNLQSMIQRVSKEEEGSFEEEDYDEEENGRSPEKNLKRGLSLKTRNRLKQRAHRERRALHLQQLESRIAHLDLSETERLATLSALETKIAAHEKTIQKQLTYIKKLEEWVKEVFGQGGKEQEAEKFLKFLKVENKPKPEDDIEMMAPHPAGRRAAVPHVPEVPSSHLIKKTQSQQQPRPSMLSSSPTAMTFPIPSPPSMSSDADAFNTSSTTPSSSASRSMDVFPSGVAGVPSRSFSLPIPRQQSQQVQPLTPPLATHYLPLHQQQQQQQQQYQLSPQQQAVQQLPMSPIPIHSPSSTPYFPHQLLSDPQSQLDLFTMLMNSSPNRDYYDGKTVLLPGDQSLLDTMFVGRRNPIDGSLIPGSLADPRIPWVVCKAGRVELLKRCRDPLFDLTGLLRELITGSLIFGDVWDVDSWEIPAHLHQYFPTSSPHLASWRRRFNHTGSTVSQIITSTETPSGRWSWRGLGCPAPGEENFAEEWKQISEGVWRLESSSITNSLNLHNNNGGEMLSPHSTPVLNKTDENKKWSPNGDTSIALPTMDQNTGSNGEYFLN